MSAPTVLAQLPAFPGAEGFGTNTTHGRGGQIIEVTNLNDAGPGSLRAAINTPGQRIIVFRVGGIIELKTKLNIFEPYCMIAGQTAPGDGICLKGSALNIATHDVVVRYLRVRPGDGEGEGPDDRDGIQVYPYAAYQTGYSGKAYNIVIDHCSVSWGIDENVSFYGSLFPQEAIQVRDISLQWCIVSEALDDSEHSKGPHSKGILVAGGAHRISLHHNLLAHNVERNPLFKTSTNADLVNNVLYNAPGGVGMVDEDQGAVHPPVTALNLVGNTAIAGPQTEKKAYILTVDENYLKQDALFYLEGNISKNRSSNSQDEWAGVNVLTASEASENKYRTNQLALKAPTIDNTNASDAYPQVLAKAGATLPSRDAVDTRIVAEVKNRNGSFIDSPSQVGGYPVYQSGPAPLDTDHDAMPDAWEEQYGFDKNDASDRNGDADGDGYTNVEEFLNGTPPADLTDNPPSSGAGLAYTLYDNKTLSGSPLLTGIDPTVNFDWQYGGKASGQPTNNFSVRWTGQVKPAYSQEYTFYTQADDGTRLWVNGQLLIDDWTNHAVREKQGKITLQAGKQYDIKLEYYENGGRAVCKLLWSSASQSKQAVPKASLFPDNTNARLASQITKKWMVAPSSEIILYPNPSETGNFTLSGVAKGSKVRMYDLQGRDIAIVIQTAGPRQIQVQTKSKPTQGLYFLQIQQPNRQYWLQKVSIQ